MTHSRRLYENLPIYARFADEMGLLQHICDVGIQPSLDEFYLILSLLEHYFDPDHPLSEPHLDWLGQFVGLGAIAGHYLGIGINPNWPAEAKRKLIKAAWRYWQIKGTEQGIRTAIALWLLWEKAYNPKDLEIRKPFRRNWMSFGDRRNRFRVQPWNELQRVGYGDYEGQEYRPRYEIFRPKKWSWEYGALWSDRTLKKYRPELISNDFSRMGTYSPWMHFNHLEEDEWHQIFPDILTLNPEIWLANARPTVVGWFKMPGIGFGGRTGEQLPPTYKYLLGIDGVRWSDRYQPRIVKNVQETRTATQVRWTNWEKACRYGDSWGWSTKMVAQAKLTQVVLCRWGDSYGFRRCLNPTENREEVQIVRPGYSYYGAGLDVRETVVRAEGYACRPGIEIKNRKQQVRSDRCNVLILQPFEETIPDRIVLSSSSIHYGDRFNRHLQVQRVSVESKKGRIISAQPSWGFWNTRRPQNYFCRLAFDTVTESTRSIRLCNLTRQYSRRMLAGPKIEMPGGTKGNTGFVGVGDAANWRCHLATSVGWLIYPPVSAIAVSGPDWQAAKRSDTLSKDYPYLLLEFLARPPRDTSVSAIAIHHLEKFVSQRSFKKPLFMSEVAGFGVRCIVLGVALSLDDVKI